MMPKKTDKDEKVKTTPYSPPAGKIREAGYGPSTDFEIADLDTNQKNQEKTGFNFGNSAQEPGQNTEFGNLESNQPYQNNNMNFAFGHKDNDNFEFGESNQEKYQAGYSQELNGLKTNRGKDTNHTKEKNT